MGSKTSAAVIERIGEAATPLDGVDPATPVDDLRPLERAFGDARIVGLGESTHGTREFIRLKHRLLELLVEELGIRTFALEVSFSEVLAIDDYVVRGNGRPRDACDALSYWMYDAEAMRSLFAWARAYNEGLAPSERIRFYGFDIGSERGTDAAARELRQFLSEVDPRALARFRDTLDRLVGSDADQLTAEWFEENLDLLPEFVDEVRTLLVDHRDAYSATTSEWRWKLATRCLRELEQLHEANRSDAAGARADVGGLRDEFMAENVSWILDHGETDRLALWSHNGHVMNACRDETGPVMGRHLTERHGDAYYPLALTFGYGSFRATGVSDGRQQRYTLEKPVANTLPAALTATGQSPFAIDFETALADPQLRSYFDAERPIREIGSNFDPDRERTDYYRSVRPATAFDGLVFVETSTPSTPLGGE